MKKMLKDAFILLMITLLAGAALGFVHDITKLPIAQAEENAKNEALRVVFTDAATFESTEVKNQDTALYPDCEITEVYAAKDASSNVLGYVLLVTTHAGYGGDISFAMGIRNDRVINGISILSISETAGLGMKAPEVLVPQFKNRQAMEFIVSKGGASAADEIDAISGATITSKAVTGAVNAGVAYFEVNLGGGTDEE